MTHKVSLSHTAVTSELHGPFHGLSHMLQEGNEGHYGSGLCRAPLPTEELKEHLKGIRVPPLLSGHTVLLALHPA